MVSLVHTDISKIDLRILRDKKYGNKLQTRAINYLIQEHKYEELWFPAYNYDFGKNKVFNPKKDGTSVGVINAEVLKMPNSLRTFTPMYSYVGLGNLLEPKIKDIYRPFGNGSELQNLLDLEAEILFFGAGLNSFTFIHYIEELNQIGYRYLKKIEGSLEVNEKIYSTAIELKVRPLGRVFNYNWEKIEADLIENKIIRFQKKISNNIFTISMAESLNYITKKLKSDPYYLLDQQTAEWVSQFLDDTGRPFLADDFEAVNK